MQCQYHEHNGTIFSERDPSSWQIFEFDTWKRLNYVAFNVSAAPPCLFVRVYVVVCGGAASTRVFQASEGGLWHGQHQLVASHSWRHFVSSTHPCVFHSFRSLWHGRLHWNRFGVQLLYEYVLPPLRAFLRHAKTNIFSSVKMCAPRSTLQASVTHQAMAFANIRLATLLHPWERGSAPNRRCFFFPFFSACFAFITVSTNPNNLLYLYLLTVFWNPYSKANAVWAVSGS